LRQWTSERFKVNRQSAIILNSKTHGWNFNHQPLCIDLYKSP
jgi:hypothetical protein